MILENFNLDFRVKTKNLEKLYYNEKIFISKNVESLLLKVGFTVFSFIFFYKNDNIKGYIKYL